MKQLRQQLTYANVVATLALFLVVAGGSAYAATQLAKNSVGSKQIKKNAVTAAKIKQGAVTPAKLSKASKAALKGETGSRGLQGPQGPSGQAGAAGATKVVVREETAAVSKESFYVNYVFCDPGEVATGGGAGFTENAGQEIVEQSFPMTGKKGAAGKAVAGETPTGWGVFLRNNSAFPRTGQWFVVCASP